MAYRCEEFKAGERITIDQVRAVQVDILKYFASYCYEHQLRFFLAGGTLIGAVRHHGYVPWDDDLDIVMPRPDWEKFISMNRIEFGPYEIRSYQYTPEIHPRPLLRIVDKRYFMQINHIQHYLPLWIDVEPLDGLPSNTAERKKHFARAKILQKLIAGSYSDFFKVRKRWLRALKRLVFLPLRMIGPLFFIKKLEKLGKKYDYESAEYAGTFTCGYGFSEGVRKRVYATADFTDFCGETFPIPAGYDEILTNNYKEYMMLPPARKRRVHMIGAWVNDNYSQEKA